MNSPPRATSIRGSCVQPLGFWMCGKLFPHGGGLYKDPLLKLSGWRGFTAERVPVTPCPSLLLLAEFSAARAFVWRLLSLLGL